VIDLGVTLHAMLAAVRGAQTADDAWKEVVAVARQMGVVIPDDLRQASAEAEVQIIAAQLRTIVERNPIPPSVTFLYFGLFGAVRLGSGEEAAGFYVAGGSGSDAEPAIDRPEDLVYFPLDRYLESPLLDRVKAEALHAGEDYNSYDYALMFGAAAILAKFAMRELGLKETLLVGFDSGDRAVVT
jgi:hypothetical protein